MTAKYKFLFQLSDNVILKIKETKPITQTPDYSKYPCFLNKAKRTKNSVGQQPPNIADNKTEITQQMPSMMILLCNLQSC